VTSQPAYPDLMALPCTNCGVKGGLQIEMRLEAKPPSTYSLAGAQPKVAARSWPWMVCRNCSAECRGKV
jgi:hypothetical protein